MVRELLQPAPDLDGDGVGDLVFVLDRFVLAISGKTGKLLWCRELHSNVFITKTEAETVLAGPPFVVADIDGDGCPDLILAHGGFWCEVRNREKRDVRVVIRPCVEALSGRTGATLWRHQSPSLAERLIVNENESGRRIQEEVRRNDFSHFQQPIPITGFASFTERRTDAERILLAGLFPGLERLDLRTGQPVAPPDPPPHYVPWRRSDDPRYGGPRGRRVHAWSADGTVALVTDPDETGEGAEWNLIDTFSGVELEEKKYPSWYSTAVFADLDGDGVPEMITLGGGV
jgi:hypothetical protein